MRTTVSVALLLAFLFVASTQAQTQAPSTLQPLTQTQVATSAGLTRDVMAVTFPQDKQIVVKMRGNPRLPDAEGEVKVERKRGTTELDVKINDVKPASLFGGDFNTYVLWVVSPEGQIQNVGELILNGDEAKLDDVSTNLGAFGIFVSAEPHYLVNVPSRFVVLEMSSTVPELPRTTALATIRYREGEGVYNHEREHLNDAIEAKGLVVNDIKQAFTAVQLAERAGAAQFANQEWAAAQRALKATMTLSEQGKKRREIDAQARETVRLAVAAQTLAQTRAFQASLDAERRARQQQMDALESQIRQASNEAERAKLEAERRQLELEAEARAREEASKRADEAGRRAAEEQRLRSAAELGKADAEARARAANEVAAKAQQERDAIYNQMRESLSRIVQIRQSARGLILDIPDVLFDFDKATLRTEGRERLSKIAGVIMATPGAWGLTVEGHTDDVGKDDYNQNLSEKRAETVRGYLVSAGVPRDSVSAAGFGESRPIASNATGDGRQRNRRVEIIVEDRLRPPSKQ